MRRTRRMTAEDVLSKLQESSDESDQELEKSHPMKTRYLYKEMEMGRLMKTFLLKTLKLIYIVIYIVMYIVKSVTMSLLKMNASLKIQSTPMKVTRKMEI